MNWFRKDEVKIQKIIRSKDKFRELRELRELRDRPNFGMRLFNLSDLVAEIKKLGHFDEGHYEWIKNNLPTLTLLPGEWSYPTKEKKYYEPYSQSQRMEALRSDSGIEILFHLYETSVILSPTKDSYNESRVTSEAIIRGPWKYCKVPGFEHNEHKNNIPYIFTKVAEKIAADHKVFFDTDKSPNKIYRKVSDNGDDGYLDEYELKWNYTHDTKKSYAQFFAPLDTLEGFVEKANNILAAEKALVRAFDRSVDLIYSLSSEEDKK